MKVAILLMASLPLMAAQSSARPADRSPACLPLASLISSPVFDGYPAPSDWTGPIHRPDVRSGVAHLYRTSLSREAVGPPNFAGKYQIVTHGCGAGMTCPLFVNLETGRVSLDPMVSSVFWDMSGTNLPELGDYRLVFRRDSRLLITLGLRNEDPKTGGVSMLEWTGQRMRLVRFVPTSRLCESAPESWRAR